VIVEKVVSEGISHNSYFIGSNGEAAVIDPRRDCEVYVYLAEQHGCKITHIFETHRNEDYVIGSLNLAWMTGVDIYHGSHHKFAYGNGVKEGDTFKVGSLELSVLETPGHTIEHISIAVRDKSTSNEIMIIFTGDALFAGDVGRTDFYPDRMEEMAGKLYDSIVDKILSAGEGVIIYPAHGEGSVCGEEISDHPVTTVGYEKKTNPLLKKTRDEFVAYKVRERHYTPPYFKKMEVLNTYGAPPLYNLPFLRPLAIAEIKQFRDREAQLLDIRAPTSYGCGYIPGSINIWREGLSSFVGWVCNYGDPIIIIDDFNLELEGIVRQLVRLGYDNLIGYCAGGFPAWYLGGQDVHTIEQLSPAQLQGELATVFLVDVRSIGTWETIGYIKGAHHIWVGDIKDRLADIPRNRHIVTYCDSGYKGTMAASILKLNGYANVATLLGGMAAWKNSGLPIVSEKNP